MRAFFKQGVLQKTFSIIAACALVCSLIPATYAFALSSGEVAEDGTYSGTVTARKNGESKTKTATIEINVSDGVISSISYSGSNADDFQKYMPSTGTGKKGTSRVSSYIGQPASIETVDAISSASIGSGNKYSTNIADVIRNLIYAAPAAQTDKPDTPGSQWSEDEPLEVGCGVDAVSSATAAYSPAQNLVATISASGNANGPYSIQAKAFQASGELDRAQYGPDTPLVVNVNESFDISKARVKLSLEAIGEAEESKSVPEQVSYSISGNTITVTGFDYAAFAEEDTTGAEWDGSQRLVVDITGVALASTPESSEMKAITTQQSRVGESALCPVSVPVESGKEPGEVSDGTLEVEKSASAQDGNDNLFGLNLQAYATAKATTSTTGGSGSGSSASAIGANIVLALDVSSSMGGNTGRIESLNQAVNKFAQAAGNTELAYVTFAQGASTAKTFNSTNVPTFTVENSTGTNFAQGIRNAQSYLAGLNNGKPNIIIIFSDGQPEYISGEASDAQAITNAINAATEVKNAGTTIYVLNVASGASASATPSTRFLAKATGMGALFGYGEDPVNTTMQYLSSNYINSKATVLDHGMGSIEVTGAQKVDSGYYRVGSGSDWTSLFESAAQDIAEQNPGASEPIETTTYEINSNGFDANSVFTDCINTDAFDASNATVEAKVYDWQDGAWSSTANETATRTLNVTFDKESGKITVSGFDYSSHWLADNGDEAEAGAQKLVVTVKGLQGKQKGAEQTQVPTNTSDSGVYKDDNSTNPDVAFPVPTVTIPAKELAEIPDSRIAVRYIFAGSIALCDGSIIYYNDNEEGLTIDYAQAAAYESAELSNADIADQVAQEQTFRNWFIEHDIAENDIDITVEDMQETQVNYFNIYTGEAFKSIPDGEDPDEYVKRSVTAIVVMNTFEAQASDCIAYYTVTWVNEDGTVLEEDVEVAEGTMPEYNGATPTKEADEDNTYEFAGWSPEVSEVTGNITYTATYDKKAIERYSVTYKDEDGTILQGPDTVKAGQSEPAAPQNPTKPADDDYTYEFDTWDKSVDEQGNITYTATYKQEPRGNAKDANRDIPQDEVDRDGGKGTTTESEKDNKATSDKPSDPSAPSTALSKPQKVTKPTYAELPATADPIITLLIVPIVAAFIALGLFVAVRKYQKH